MNKNIVVLAEDDAIARMFLEKSIEIADSKIKVISKNDGKQALDYLASNKADLLITDMKMPNLDGAELINKVRKFNKDIPIVVSSANQEDDLPEYKNLKIQDWYRKPISLEDIQKILYKYIF